MVTSVFAMNKAIEKAKTAGIAYVGVRNSCHFGAAGYYANLAAKADMIGMAMANDYPSMAILGAKKAVLGTNPFAYAVPAGKHDPIFLDIASSTVAGGKVRIAQTKNQRVPETWMVDTDGIPTTDPFLYPQSAFLLPFAGHKGYGIALMIENLAGVLTGTGAMYDLNNWIEGPKDIPTNHGAAFLAFNVGAITPLDAFKNRVDQVDRRHPRDAEGARAPSGFMCPAKWSGRTAVPPWPAASRCPPMSSRVCAVWPVIWD